MISVRSRKTGWILILFSLLVGLATLLASSIGFSFIRIPFSNPPEQTFSITPERINRAAKYSFSHGGTGLLIQRSGRIFYEDYSEERGTERPHRLAFGSLGVCGLLAVAATEDGLLRLDDPVADTIEEWRKDAGKSTITVRQLLNFTSGLNPGRVGNAPDYRLAVAYPLKDKPNTRFLYGPAPAQVFGELMHRKLSKNNMDASEYLRHRVFNPIGLNVSFWRKPQGEPNLASGVFLTARDWARLGELIRSGGEWQGRHVLRPESVAELTKGSELNPAFGLGFWSNTLLPAGMFGAEITDGLDAHRKRRADGRTITDNAPEDLVMAGGAGQQRLYIIPSLELVIVRQAEGNDFNDNDFFGLLLLGLEPGGDGKI